MAVERLPPARLLGHRRPRSACWHSGDLGVCSPLPSCSPTNTRPSSSWTLNPGAKPRGGERGAESRAAAEVAAQGGLCGSPADRWGRACPQHTRDAAIQPQNQSQSHFWRVGGEAQVQHIPPEERLFFLSPRFFTPFRESDAAPRVLRDSNSAAEQLQPACAAVFCFKQGTASPTQNVLLPQQIKSKGVEWGGGDTFPSSAPFWGSPLPRWRCPWTRGCPGTAFAQQFFCQLLPGRHQLRCDAASQPAGPRQGHHPGDLTQGPHVYFRRAPQQTVTSQLSGQQKYFHAHPQKSRSFWV